MDEPCKDCTATCPAGKFANELCSKTSDLECVGCQAGVSFTRVANLDRQCTPCLTCVAGKIQTKSCTVTRNRVCTTCTQGKFQNLPGKTSCKNCATSCNPGFVIVEECKSSANIVCQQCATGKFKVDQRTCQDCITECPVGQTRDKTCAANRAATCTACANGKFKSVVGFAACNSCTSNCGSEKFIKTACTRSADSVCQGCKGCPAGFDRKSGTCNGVIDTVCEGNGCSSTKLSLIICQIQQSRKSQ